VHGIGELDEEALNMEALDAIRLRRSVRKYTDRPVSDADLDKVLRLALLAPTGHNAQAWSFIVVRDPERRAQLADLVLRGAAEYFAVNRPMQDRTPAEHADWAAAYAEQALGSYRQVPVWVAGIVVPRFDFPDEPMKQRIERFSENTSVSFALENLFVAARALGLGTTPTIFQWFFEEEYRELLGLQPDHGVHYLTPVGYPEEFPVGLRPEAAKARRPWRTLVHDEEWGHPRQPDAPAA
jgi:nitroreductase